jgi:hypothetical protein
LWKPSCIKQLIEVECLVWKGKGGYIGDLGVEKERSKGGKCPKVGGRSSFAALFSI